ncbi:MAG: nucleotidyltransferase domain-containing protein, partial [Rhodospirillaceae bacterium]
MSTIYKPREIIDRRQVHVALDAIAAEDTSEEVKRPAVLETMKTAYKAGFDVIHERFEKSGASGTDTVAAHSYLMDQVIRIIFDYAISYSVRRGVPTTGERISIVAIGGYGRGELAPLSDVDLLFLLPYKQTPFTEQLVEFMLYLLWDMGLKVGHAVRSVEDNISHAKVDMTIRTTLLEARWVWGDQELAAELNARFKREIKRGTAQEFV